MKKALMVMTVLALVVPASADLLTDYGPGTPWQAGWGSLPNISYPGGNVIRMDYAGLPDPHGSAGLYWRIPAFESELVDVWGEWVGNTGSGGWAEVMLFTSMEGQPDGDVVARADLGNASDIIAKHDSWSLGPNPWGPEPISAAPNPGGDNPIHATCNEIIVVLKLGDHYAAGSGNAWAEWDIQLTPEPGSALLLLGGLPLLLRRRRA